MSQRDGQATLVLPALLPRGDAPTVECPLPWIITAHADAQRVWRRRVRGTWQYVTVTAQGQVVCIGGGHTSDVARTDLMDYEEIHDPAVLDAVAIILYGYAVLGGAHDAYSNKAVMHE